MLDVVAGQIAVQVSLRGEPLVHLVVAEPLRRKSSQPQPEAHADAHDDGGGQDATPRRGASAQLHLRFGHGAAFYHCKGLAQNRSSVKLRRK